MDNQSEQHNQTPRTSERRGFFFWTGRILLALFLFFFSILIIIQLPPVQLWGARQLSKSIGKTLNTRVSIGGFNLHPLSDLSLKDVFIGSPDYPEDTLILAQTLNVDFHRLWSILNNQLTVNQVVIDNGFLNIEKKAGDTLTNLDLALLRLLPEKDTSKAAFVFDLEKISATSLNVRVNDNTKGSLINMIFPRADISLDTLDMEGQYIHAEYIDFDEPLIHITQKVTEPVIPSAIQKQDKQWSFEVDKVDWTNGKFYLNNQNKPRDTSQIFGLDYAHLNLADVDIEADSLSVHGFNMRGKDIRIHILHQNGFELKSVSAEELIMSENGVDVTDLEIETSDSYLHNDLALEYSGFSDFKSFPDSVGIVMPQADIRLHMKDLLALAPGLHNVSFFSDNQDKTILLQGDINGHINRLRILNMRAGMGGISLEGDFRSRDLAISGSQLISLDMDRAVFSAASLKDIFPRMNVPPVLSKLGQIDFTGKFDGYPDDFVAFGNFNTALGNMTLDMNLNFVRGFSNARYSGTVSMDNFNLGAFLGNPDIGRTSMTGRVIEGKGLTMTTLEADITAVMSFIEFKGYTYRNARLDGQISGRYFTGTMAIHDPNVDMSFEGTVDYTGKTPRFDFITRVDSVRFLPLGFGKEPIAISGIFDVDLTASSLQEFRGTILGEKVTISINDVDYFLDSLYVDALVDSLSGDRFYHIKSDVVSGVVSGVFDPVTLPNLVHQYLHEHYPSTIGPPQKVIVAETPPRVSWDIRIHDSGLWLDLAGIPGLLVKKAYTHGNLNLQEQRISGFLELPELHYGTFNVYGTSINFDENKGRLDADLEIIAADVKENFFFEDVVLQATGTDDSLRLRMQTDHIAEIIDELDIEILADPEDGNWTFSINPLRLEMLGDNWMIPPGNLVEIRDSTFSLENFEIVSGDRRIVVDDINNRGIEAFITGFDISYLNTLWINDKFEFTGIYTLDLEIDDLYDIQQMSTVVHVPEMKVNNIPYGEWVLNASMEDPQDSVRIDLVMDHNETHLTGKGAFLPPIKSIPKENQNYLRLDLDATDFPLDFLEFLMGGNIRNTEGSVDLALSLKGKIDKLNPSGRGKVYNGSTIIDYLGTAYSFHDQSFTISESMIDLSGTRIYDVHGNFATVEGGITHRYLRDLGLDATIRSDKIIALDVTSEENSNFYGMGIGSIYARFTGTIANINMYIEVGNTAQGTHIYIPLSSGITTEDRDFVIFLENGALPADRNVPFNLSGINLTMNLNINENTIVDIIFDENTGEVLQASGIGALQVNMSRTGNLSMYGSFQITEGDYLFTNFAVVRKPFELVPGGVIRWAGDPYEATLNVQARYKGLTAPIYPLIQEYLVNPDAGLIEAARERTDVDLTMTLTGSLLQPNIDFEIGFPNLTGQVKGYAESKIQALEDNQNAMMEQVMGLLLTRSFLPSLGSGALGLDTKILNNTVSELLASTLSSYLSGLLGEIIPEGQFLTGVSFEADIDISPFQEGVVEEEDLAYLNSTAFGINLPLEFFNDRLSLTVGGDYVTGASFTDSKGYTLAGDVTFEYKLTSDGWLRLRAYNRTSPTIEGRKNKVGVGLAYRREYESLTEIFGKRKKKQQGPRPDQPENGE